jgi:hypothetical protein
LGGDAQAASASLAPVTEPDPRLVRHFGIFRNSPEPIPGGWRARLEESQDPSLNPSALVATSNYSLAQRATIRGQEQRTHSVWIVPARGYVTLMNFGPRTASGFPASVATVIRHGLTRKQFGLVPDGIVAVQLSRSVKAAVRENFYSVRADPSTLWRHPRFIHGATTSHGDR